MSFIPKGDEQYNLTTRRVKHENQTVEKASCPCHGRCHDDAENREESDIIYTGLPTARPVPTFAISGESGFMQDASTMEPESTAEPETDDLSEPASETAYISPATVAPSDKLSENLSYDDIPGTPPPAPTDTPEPSATPVPTFSLTNLTPDGEE